MRPKAQNKLNVWTIRLDAALIAKLRAMGRKAAPWVRRVLWEALNK